MGFLNLHKKKQIIINVTASITEGNEEKVSQAINKIVSGLNEEDIVMMGKLMDNQVMKTLALIKLRETIKK